MRKQRIVMLAAEIILLIVIGILLFNAANHYMKDVRLDDVVFITDVKAEVEGKEMDVTLPYSFQSLAPRTPVTITANITLNPGDIIYLKSVYSPEKVYIDGRLVYEFGDLEDYPSFMVDPATEVYLLNPKGVRGETTLRMEFLSPVARETLTVHAPIQGDTKRVFITLINQMKWPFLFSVMQVMAGLLIVIISSSVILFERKGAVFFWLGLFSLASGLWAFGECDLTGLFIKNPTLLYLFAFVGLLSITIPILHFAMSIISFHNPKPMQAVSLGITLSTVVALVLQLVGAVPLSESMYFFHAAVPLVFCMLTVASWREAIRYKNIEAQRFLIPMTTLCIAVIVEVANYQLKLTYQFAMIFQMGVLFFIVFTGITGGLYIREDIQLRQHQRQLAYEVNLLEMQVEEQKKRSVLLVNDEEKIKQQRHDLRHQLTVLNELANTDIGKLQEYIGTLIENIPAPRKRYCENIAVNIVVSRYASLCEEKGIEFVSKLIMPVNVNEISDSELCVVFGNMLENAVEACERMSQEQTKFIHISSSVEHDTLTIVMDNSFDGDLKEINGRFRSRKREDFGVGLSSVQTIARKHQGDARFEKEGVTFLSSVYLKV